MPKFIPILLWDKNMSANFLPVQIKIARNEYKMWVLRILGDRLATDYRCRIFCLKVEKTISQTVLGQP